MWLRDESFIHSFIKNSSAIQSEYFLREYWIVLFARYENVSARFIYQECRKVQLRR